MRTSKPLIVVSLAIAVLAFAAPASAVTACFNLSPFCDVLQFDFTVGTSGQVDGAGGWWACPPKPGSSYFLPITVGLSSDLVGSFRVGIHGTHSTSFFGGFHSCIIDGTITAPSFSGPALIDCDNGFQVPGITLVPIPCPAPLQELPGTPAGASR